MRRALWRVHGVAGLLCLPVLVVLATSGLVTLHGEIVARLLDPDATVVAASTAETTLDAQVDAAVAAVPDAPLLALTTSAGPTSPTVVRFAGVDHDVLVSVDPHTARVTAVRSADEGFVALATRVHAYLGVDTAIVRLPTVAALVDDGPALVPIQLGDAIAEVTAVWALVLVATGLVLWRRPQTAASRGIVSRRARARRRHATPGAAAAVAVVVALLTAMTWSTYWGTTWRRVAAAVDGTPAAAPPPASAVMSMDDITGMEGMDGMTDVDHHDSHDMGSMTRITLNEVAAVAADLGFEPGYTITPPQDAFGIGGSMVHGAFTVTTPATGREADRRTTFVDQFDGTVLETRGPSTDGLLARATAVAQQTHIGTQFGPVSRLVMTIACLAVDWSAISAVLMWWRRRRRAGGLALPPRTVAPRLPRPVRRAALVVGVVFPLWGATALAAAGVDLALRRRAQRRPRPTPHS